MTDEEFRKLCNVYGFAPSRALRELIDCVRVQEIEACARACDEFESEADPDAGFVLAAAIRARKDKQ